MKKITMGLILATFVAANQSPKEIEQNLLKFIKSQSNKEAALSSAEAVGNVSLGSGWYGVSVDFGKSGARTNEIFLTNGVLLAQNIVNMENREDFRAKASEELSSPLDEDFYSVGNLIYGSADSKDRIVVFSNPMCPHCLNYMYHLHEYVKGHQDLAVYYYPTPMSKLFPHADMLMLGAESARLSTGDASGEWALYENLFKDTKLYELASKGETQEVLKKVFGDLDFNKSSTLARKKLNNDAKKADLLEVRGTPTVYVNGRKDPTLQRAFRLREEK